MMKTVKEEIRMTMLHKRGVTSLVKKRIKKDFGRKLIVQYNSKGKEFLGI